MTSETCCKLHCSARPQCVVAWLEDCRDDGQCECHYCNAALAAVALDYGDRYYLFTQDIKGLSPDSVGIPEGLGFGQPLLIVFTLKSPYTSLKFLSLSGAKTAFEMIFDFVERCTKVKDLSNYLQWETRCPSFSFAFTDGQEISLLFSATDTGNWLVFSFPNGNRNVRKLVTMNALFSDLSRFKLESKNQEAVITSFSI